MYILTREENQYDQYGEYFVAWFSIKPTREKLEKFFTCESTIDNLLENGGGRVDNESTWYNLQIVQQGVMFDPDNN